MIDVKRPQSKRCLDDRTLIVGGPANEGEIGDLVKVGNSQQTTFAKRFRPSLAAASRRNFWLLAMHDPSQRV